MNSIEGLESLRPERQPTEKMQIPKMRRRALPRPKLFRGSTGLSRTSTGRNNKGKLAPQPMSKVQTVASVFPIITKSEAPQVCEI